LLHATDTGSTHPENRQLDPHAEARRIFTLGFTIGRQAGHEDLEPALVQAEADADYWYFLAHNPAEKDRISRQTLAHLDGLAQRQQDEAARAKWAADEQAAIDRAQQMIWAGADDVAIAVETGLFLPMVANIRAGVIS